jgi:hypothetical protein
MKATALLEKQHRAIESTLSKLEVGKGDRLVLLREVADALAAHMAIEQEIFYPAVQAIERELVTESFEEHALAELALRRLLATSPGDPSFLARVMVLRELVSNHVHREERELFPPVDAQIDATSLNDMGRRMKAMFDEALLEGFESLLPKSMRTTTADEAMASSKARRQAAAHSHATTR